ncbi:hypothetical protein CTAYLR_002871 [Chrysophaeum taylorii]|uniref:COP9 signalosome complex subunit 6 n=1 Tax=Chrysophaeum taylorii TaxID=2483200 RepID=A0AAD7XL16_9STRA|nr:hypothetical protein CTAYLR_002871 [Chrysophaeum taylorii]
MSGSEGGRRVALHPLAIVGVSDHFTRVKVGGGKQASSAPIIGLLFGKQSGLEVSIYDAIELVSDPPAALDETYLLKQTELFTAVYKDRELLGWYTVAKEATSDHLALHKDFLKYNESPLFLIMDPSPSADSKELPITIFEYELHMVNETPTMLFVSIPYQLQTLQAEQIAMEQVAKTTPADTESALDVHIENVDSSLKTLRHRVLEIVKYLDLVSSGKAQVDYGLLRHVSNLCDQLPAAEPADLKEEFIKDYNDSLAVSVLAAVSKSADSLNELTDNFLVIHAHGSKLA